MSGGHGALHAKLCGSWGLSRKARATRSIAASGSPSQTFTQPLKSHAHAKFGLRTSARFVKASPASRSPTTKARAIPAEQSAAAPSLPDAAGRRARRIVSATSPSRSVTHPLPSILDITSRRHAIGRRRARVLSQGDRRGRRNATISRVLDLSATSSSSTRRTETSPVSANTWLRSYFPLIASSGNKGWVGAEYFRRATKAESLRWPGDRGYVP
jgi:hypothetical protein